jgi:hypothetical protein
MQERPFALLIDDGELDSVAEIIEGLGVHPARLQKGAERSGWRQPERLLVVSGGRAIRLPHPQAEEETGGRHTRIAIVDQASKTLRAQIERMGFDVVVYRPVHPEALRLLIASAIHRGREQRVRPRFPVGCEIHWRTGFRKRSATLTEISARGCRLLMRNASRPPSLKLLLPGSLTGGHDLKIPCTVVRYERLPDDFTVASVVFDTLEAVDRVQLGSLLESLMSGPPSLAA